MQAENERLFICSGWDRSGNDIHLFSEQTNMDAELVTYKIKLLLHYLPYV